MNHPTVKVSITLKDGTLLEHETFIGDDDETAERFAAVMMSKLTDRYCTEDEDVKVANWAEVAHGAIERHLGDVCEESPDAIYDEAYTLAHDALTDAGCPLAEINAIANEQAMLIAQP